MLEFVSLTLYPIDTPFNIASNYNILLEYSYIYANSSISWQNNEFQLFMKDYLSVNRDFLILKSKKSCKIVSSFHISKETPFATTTIRCFPIFATNFLENNFKYWTQAYSLLLSPTLFLSFITSCLLLSRTLSLSLITKNLTYWATRVTRF